MDKEKVGALIRELRKERGMTQKELAQKLHVTDKAVSKWERGLSFPDITLMEKLAEVLQVGIYELMCGEKKQEEPIARQQVDTVLADTVQEAYKKQRRQKRKFTLLLAAVFLWFGIVLLFIFKGKEIINAGLSVWAAANETVYHSCEFTVHPGAVEGLEGFYIYKDAAAEADRYRYHIMGVDGEGKSRELFWLEEYGMDLERAPGIRADEEYLYVLFDGLDNEAPAIRLYGNEVGADPQGFFPFLYRYQFSTGLVEEVALCEPETSLLLDAFTWQGETVYLEGRFQGIFGGLNLGFYRGDGCFLSLSGAADIDLTGSGGLQIRGCLVQDAYYVCGRDGVYCFDLSREKVRQVMQLDLKRSMRAELLRWENADAPGWILIYEEAAETDGDGKISACRTWALMLDEDFHITQRLALEQSASAVEWGSDSVIISGLGSRVPDIKMTKLSFADFAAEDVTGVLTDAQKKVLAGQCRSQKRPDELEQSRFQWVFLEQKKSFVPVEPLD